MEPRNEYPRIEERPGVAAREPRPLDALERDLLLHSSGELPWPRALLLRRRLARHPEARPLLETLALLELAAPPAPVPLSRAARRPGGRAPRLLAAGAALAALCATLLLVRPGRVGEPPARGTREGGPELPAAVRSAGDPLHREGDRLLTELAGLVYAPSSPAGAGPWSGDGPVTEPPPLPPWSRSLAARSEAGYGRGTPTEGSPR